MPDGLSRAPGVPPRMDAVLYVKSLGAMRAFYERCFGLSKADLAGDDYCVLASETWELSLVSVPEAVATTLDLSVPPRRRERSALKLSFEVADIERMRPVLAEGSGRVDPADSGWEFRGFRHIDCVDPEGNVLQLREPVPEAAETAPPTFDDQELTGRDFSGRNLRGASMANSNLTNARFAGADLEEARFDGANLTNADFREARLEGCSFVDANLTRSSLVRASAQSSDFGGANLTASDLSSADLRSAKLRGASMMYANLDGVDLERAVLTKSVGQLIVGVPARMPTGWSIADGGIVGRSRR